MKTKIFLTVAVIALSLSAVAQTNSQTTVTVEPLAPTPMFRVNVISRTVQAVNYQHRSGATKLDFAGTDLMPSANGEAEVNSKRGSIEIKVEFGNLEKPTTFGNEYLTYILWAISPEGRAVNLGEVLVGGNHRSKLVVTTDLQAFALIVTAEPYYAVRQPSNAVVLENVVREDTKGTTEAVNAKYELMERGGYIPTGYKFDPVVLNAKLPLEFFEARNALRIAQSEGAEEYASDSYQRAVRLMNNADGYATEKNVPRKPLIAVSREAVQTAEDARAIAVKKMDEQRLANERQASADAQAQSQAQADDATRQKEQAQANAAKAQSDMAANQAASAAAVTAAQADADQSRLVKPGAREKLAKVAGILLAYPGLNIEVDGYTDNVGGDEMNQQLSENRARSVRDYLVQQGVATNSVSAKGFGNTLPVATNDNAAGRQQNRRVELVVSGDAIGNPITTTGSLQ